MLLPILTGLAIALLAVFAVLAAIFFRAAFRGEADMAAQAKTAARWRPPFLSGDALRDWAAHITEQLTRDRLAQERSARTAAEIMAEVNDGAVHAMLPLAREADRERIVPCPDGGQGIMGVTAIEILAIAAELRRTCTTRELELIHARAAQNARTIAEESKRPRSAPIPCPLQGEHRVCCTYATRPLHCRPLHATAVAESAPGTQSDPDAAKARTHERCVAEGIERGLQQALTAAHLDASRYEFNSALARALETHEIADRWANGEAVFESCGSAGDASRTA